MWRDLGLRLGILQPTLEDIDDKRGGSPAECMYDVLSCWLERQDKVMERGVPSWNTLVHTLEHVNKAAADSIRSEKCKAACICMKDLHMHEYIKPVVQ